MKKTLFALAAILLAAAASLSQTAWTVDNAHSNVRFAVSHLVISEVEGSFKVYSGTVDAKPDFTDARIEFAVDVASVNTENEMRDKHLMAGDFFDAETYPTMTFKSGSWTNVGGKNYRLEGELTIRNVTKTVSFDVVYGGTIVDPWGNTRAGFKATATINRFDYDLKWNALTEAGGMTVGKDVSITINLELTKKASS